MKLDARFATLVVGLLGLFFVSALFSRLEWYDWIAYALPAANLVERGSLALPQYGSQFGFDRFWLFNSPLLAGPYPLFALFGVDRITYLAGLGVFGFLNAFMVIRLVRDGLALRSWLAAVLAACAFLLHRQSLHYLYNQTYRLACISALLLAFWPSREERKSEGSPAPIWKWALVGCFPLFHPGLLPGYVAWIGWQVWNARAVGLRALARPMSALLGGGILTLLWYGRLEAFQTQFLAHLSYHSQFLQPRFRGFLYTSTSVVGSIPSWVVAAGVAALVVGFIALALRRRLSKALQPVMPAVVALGLVLLLEGAKGFLYSSFYLLALGPVLLLGLREFPRVRKGAAAALVALGLASLGISFKLDRHRPLLAGQRDTVEFLVRNTRPGDRIVASPPFVLAAAAAALPEGRRVIRLVPVAFGLESLDRQAYLQELRAQADVYVGLPAFFERVRTPEYPADGKIFTLSEDRHERFFDEEILVARRR